MVLALGPAGGGEGLRIEDAAEGDGRRAVDATEPAVPLLAADIAEEVDEAGLRVAPHLYTRIFKHRHFV